MRMDQAWDSVALLRRSYARGLEPVCAQFRLTRMELDVLLFLANNPGRDTAAEMIRLRGFSKSHVSASVKSLTRRGYLTRVIQPGNHKLIHLRLLPPSDQAVQAGQQAQQRFFRFLFQDVTQEEAELLARTLNHMVARLQSASAEEAGPESLKEESECSILF